MSLRAQVDQLLAKVQPAPLIALAAQTIESICALVEAGSGVAIIHPYASHVVRMRQLAAAILDHETTLDLAVVTPQSPPPAQFVASFLSVVERLFERASN